MSTIQLDIPEEILISLKETPETIARELQILAAVKLFELGKLSSGRAAQLAGISRVEFLMLLGRYQVSPFSLTTEELEYVKARSPTCLRSRGSEPPLKSAIANHANKSSTATLNPSKTL
nr:MULTISPECIES: UPF0175 family protein [unclassified Coleofasciculus]